MAGQQASHNERQDSMGLHSLPAASRPSHMERLKAVQGQDIVSFHDRSGCIEIEAQGESLHCALLLDYVPPEEPPSTPLGNALRIR